MARSYLSAFKKIEIVKEAQNSGNIYGTARKQDVWSNQIRAWQKIEQKSIQKTSKSNSSVGPPQS